MSIGVAGESRSVLERTLFARKLPVTSSIFLRPMHPKTAIRPDPQAIQRILALGWVAQLKIHGHRAQIHIPADESAEIIAFNRHGSRHKKALSPSIQKELRRVFAPKEGWNVIDTEWLKPEDKIYVFDIIKQEGKLLRHLAFPQRWKLLPRAYLSPHLSTLPLLTTQAECLKALASNAPHVEGLVFKAGTRAGFADSSILRCRKR